MRLSRTTAAPAEPPQAVLAYLFDILGANPTLLPGDAAANLPNLLANFYTLTSMDLLGQRCLLLNERTAQSVTPAVVRKHTELVARHRPDLCIFVPKAIDAPARARLIEQRVPFIVPGNQLYLPDLGIDLRDHFRRLRQHRESLSPAAQVAMLAYLLGLAPARITPQDLAAQRGYSAMTMTRVADELSLAGLVASERVGRHRWLTFPADRKAAWVQARALLESPVQSRVWVKGAGMLQLPRAGLTALAALTDLAAPAVPCLAVGPAAWRDLKETAAVRVVHEEEAEGELEVWSYDPVPMVTSGHVDPLSLYLSLCANDDDRVSMALDQLMDGLLW
jgi:hypothetical protein